MTTTPTFQSELDQVLAAIRQLRAQADWTEYTIHMAIAMKLDGEGIRHSHEHRLGPKCRIDVLTNSGIGIEVKKGKPNSAAVAKQLSRYAKFESVKCLVLIVGGNIFKLRREINGKPVHYISLNSLWGVAI